MTATDLNARFAIPDRVSIVEGHGGLPKVVLTSTASTAEVYLHGAHVTSWRPHDGGETLFLSSVANFADGKAIRGGIPICFPWFRSKRDDPSAPAHGFVRTREWQIDAAAARPDGSVRIDLTTGSDQESERWWPHSFRVMYSVTVSDSLQLDLSVHNVGDSSFEFEEALHTYFQVSDVEKASVQGLDGVRYLDNQDENKEKTQTGRLVLTAPTDNAYMQTAHALQVTDPQSRRILQTEKENSQTTIVWNPWATGASKFPDMADEEWKGMICVEASNILGCSVRLTPGGVHTMSATIRVSSLNLSS